MDVNDRYEVMLRYDWGGDGSGGIYSLVRESAAGFWRSMLMVIARVWRLLNSQIQR